MADRRRTFGKIIHVRVVYLRCCCLSRSPPPAVAGESVSREMEGGWRRACSAVGNNHLDVALNEVEFAAQDQSQFQTGTAGQGRPAAGPRQTDQQFWRCPQRTPRPVQDLREEANVTVAARTATTTHRHTEIFVATLAEATLCGGGGYREIHAVPVRECEWRAALCFRFLHQRRQKRRGQSLRRRPEHAAGCVFRQRAPDQGQAHRFLRSRAHIR